MSSIDFTSPHMRSAGLGQSCYEAVLNGMAGLRMALRRWLPADDSPSQLLRLSDHLLRDAGLSRAELERQAMMWQPRLPQASR